MLLICYTYILRYRKHKKGQKMTTNKIAKRIVTLSLITGTIIYATDLVQVEPIPTEKSYQEMSLTQLQEKVETLSQDGDLPFDMGLELIERWTQEA